VFSPLFNLPGMTETLTLSLFADALAVRWLIVMTAGSCALYLLDFLYRSRHESVQLPALHLAQAGVSILFLSGSLPTGAIGWALALIAVLFAANDSKKTTNTRMSSSFTVLMVSVFMMVAAALLLYAITGRLAYSNDPDTYKSLINNMIAYSSDAAVIHVLTLASVSLLMTALPGLALVPFSFWLSKTRDMHPLNALFIYVNILPATIVILERYEWLFLFTPLICNIAVLISLISITISYTAIFSQTGTRLTMLWLAITCSAQLLIAIMSPSILPVPFVLLAIYPGLFMFGFGRILEFVYKYRNGRLIQSLGIVLPPVISVFYLVLFTPETPAAISSVLVGLVIYLIPAVRIFRSSGAILTDDAAFSSSLGWSAYRFFGIQSLMYYLVIRPIEYLSEGFLILESSINFFLIHSLARAICFCGQVLCYFDKIVVGGSVCWLRNKQPLNKSDRNQIDNTLLLFILGAFIVGAFMEGRII
jgi:hypothetical protein